jgi:hypothetical protein
MVPGSRTPSRATKYHIVETTVSVGVSELDLLCENANSIGNQRGRAVLWWIGALEPPHYCSPLVIHVEVVVKAVAI